MIRYRWVIAAVGWLPVTSVVATETIFRCTRLGETTYSDRPCAPDAAVHESDAGRVTLYTPPPISQHASRSPSSKAAANSSKHRKDPAATQAKHETACTKLAQSLREVRTKLRTGYGVKEGQRLTERQKALAGRRRAEKCG